MKFGLKFSRSRLIMVSLFGLINGSDVAGLGWAWQITIPECITRSMKSSPTVTNNNDCPANSETIFRSEIFPSRDKWDLCASKCFLAIIENYHEWSDIFSQLSAKTQDSGGKILDFLEWSSGINLLKSTFGGLKHLSKRILLNKQKINQNIIVEIKDSRLRSMSSQRGLNEGWSVVNEEIEGFFLKGVHSESLWDMILKFSSLGYVQKFGEN